MSTIKFYFTVFLNRSLWLMFPTRKIANDIVIYLRGRIDHQDSKKIEDFIVNEISNNRGCDLTINLKDVEYLSSSGLRIFLSAQRILIKNGQSLKLSNLQEPVEKLLEAAQLKMHLKIYEDERDALDDVN